MSSLQSFSLCDLNWRESFENLDNILGDWVKKRPKKSCYGIEKQEEKTSHFFFRK